MIDGSASAVRPLLRHEIAADSRRAMHNASEVRALAFFHALAELALVCFAAYLHRWLWCARRSAQRVATLALVFGRRPGLVDHPSNPHPLRGSDWALILRMAH